MASYEEILTADNERMDFLKNNLIENENFENMNELLGLLIKYNKLEEVKELIIYLLDITKHLPDNEKLIYHNNLKKLFNSLAVNINDFNYMNWSYCDNKNKALIMLWKPYLIKNININNQIEEDNNLLKTDYIISKAYANLLMFYKNNLFNIVDEKWKFPQLMELKML